MPDHSPSRRQFLKPATAAEPPSVSALQPPAGGSTIRVSTRAMACEFSVIMNPGAHEQVTQVGEILELIHAIEGWLSVYRPQSEISRVNRLAADSPVRIERPFFELLQMAQQLSLQTDGAFDIASGAITQLWRKCRAEQRIPTAQESDFALERSGARHLVLDDATNSVAFDIPGVQLDPGAIGKGYALDEARSWLTRLPAAPVDFLLHGGHSSLVGRGRHNQHAGWPVGIGNPLFTKQRLGTVLLADTAMSTSGSNIQFFRHEGRRYGHILDPRTARPAEGMLSVTVFVDSAAIADALSTAFFVLGVENARKCCDNFGNVGAILIPFPEGGRRVTPTVIGVPAEQIFWDQEQVRL